MEYDALDDVPFSIRQSMHQASVFFLVTNTPSPSPQPPHSRKVMSPNPHDTLQPLQQQAAAAAASWEATAPPFVAVQMRQIAHQAQILIDENTLRQFQDSVALDSALLSDLRAAVVELHDRLHYRTGVLGSAATSLQSGYHSLLGEIRRMQGVLEQHMTTLGDLQTQTELEQVR